MKQSLKIGVVVLAVAAVSMTGLALAQDGGTVEEPPAVEEPSEEGFRGGPRHHRGGHVAGSVAEFLGIEAEELKAQLSEGMTLADIAAANGSSEDALVTYLVDELETHLAEGVTNGRITQEEADAILAEAPARITEKVNTVRPVRSGIEDRREQREERHQAVADLLGSTTEEIRAELEAGSTLGAIAAEAGVSTDELVSVMTAGLAERLDEAVANGFMTQEEADAKLAEAEANAANFIETGERPERPDRPGRGRGPGGFGPGNPPAESEVAAVTA